MSGLAGRIRALRAGHGGRFRIGSGLVGVAAYALSSVEVARWYDALRDAGAALAKGADEAAGMAIVVTLLFASGGGFSFKYPGYALPFWVAAASLSFGLGIAEGSGHATFWLWALLAACGLVLAILGMGGAAGGAHTVSGAVRRPRWGLVALCSLLCLGAGATGWGTALDNLKVHREYRARAVTVEAEVIGHRRRTASYKSSVVPVFRYVATDGRTLENIAMTDAGQPAVGTRVTLLMDPAHPGNVATPYGMSDEQVRSMFVMAGFLFLIGLLIPVRALVRARRAARQDARPTAPGQAPEAPRDAY